MHQSPLIVVAGIAAQDTVYPVTTPLVPGEKHRAPCVQTVLGGNAANAARAIVRLGGRAELLVRLGDDDLAQVIRADLDAERVGHALSQPLEGCQTSRSAIIIEPDGARTIANMFDPKFPEAPGWLPAALPTGTRAVLGDTRWEAAALHLLGLARAAGLPGVLDGDRAPQDRRLLFEASHIVFSMQGLAELTGEATPEKALQGYSAFWPPGDAATAQTIAVTNGAAGVFLLAGEGIEHLPAPVANVVDTLGAGDVWHGAFTLALAEGQKSLSAIRFANVAAAIKCSRPGGGAGAPLRAEVLESGHQFS